MKITPTQTALLLVTLLTWRRQIITWFWTPAETELHDLRLSGSPAGPVNC
jgi:hypothetical protein